MITLDSNEISRYLNSKRNLRYLERVSKAVRNDHFQNCALNSNISKKIESIIEELKLSSQEDVIAVEEFRKSAEILEKLISDSSISEKEREFLLETYRKILTHYNVESLRKPYEKSGLKDEKSEILEAIRKSKDKPKAEKVFDFVMEQERGKYIAEISQNLYLRWGEQFKYNSVYNIIGNLEDERKIETFSGVRKNSWTRQAYPSTMSKHWREKRDGKEQLIEGEIVENISDQFIPYGGRQDLNVHKFEYGENKPVYVIATEKLPKNKKLKSIGYFYKSNLEKTMRELGFEAKDNTKNFAREDSQTAWLVADGEKNLYRDDKFNQTRA